MKKDRSEYLRDRLSIGDMNASKFRPERMISRLLMIKIISLKRINAGEV